MNTYRCRRCSQRFELLDAEDVPEGEICEPCMVERSAAVPPLDVTMVFGKGGPLANGNPHYEARPGQVKLAHAINAAFEFKQHLFAEGPCGIGKSKAYGVPAAHLATNKKRVLIVTASIALQEQLVNKDLPDLQRELGWPFTFALMKGKSNYLCREEARGANDQGLHGEESRDFRDITAWARKTKEGDRSELLIKPSDLVWGRFSTTADACPGRKCASYTDCFAIRARDKAASADIIVTNYHMFFLNMAHGGTILPAVDAVILDEAHEAADIARDLLGGRVGAGVFYRIARDAKKRGATDVAIELRAAADDFFGTLRRFAESPHYKGLLRWPAPFGCERLEAAALTFEAVCAQSHLVQYAQDAIRTLKSGLTLSNPNCVYWIDVRDNRATGERRASLQARFVSVAGPLRSKLWEAYPSVVAVSATLTTDERFDFVRGELGAVPEARELAVETPFDFRRQALLVLPPSRTLPEPNDPRFVDVAARHVIETIEACGGRTLGLFTSYKQLNAIHDRVCRHFGARVRVLRQGEAPPGRLAKLFKEDARSVLLGTSSFWTGIDVPGEALTGLVIDRIPFGTPDDPVTIRMTEQNPRNVFAHFTVPKSILTFRQGIGRLIRSQSDVGVIVCLDKRLTTKGYGDRFLRSLPLMSRASSTSAIAPFLRSRGVAA